MILFLVFSLMSKRVKIPTLTFLNSSVNDNQESVPPPRLLVTLRTPHWDDGTPQVKSLVEPEPPGPQDSRLDKPRSFSRFKDLLSTEKDICWGGRILILTLSAVSEDGFQSLLAQNVWLKQKKNQTYDSFLTRLQHQKMLDCLL